MQAEKFTTNELESLDAFEGPEKTLRIYFGSSDTPSSGEGLLRILSKQWVTALDLVKCKTCGTTTLIDGLPRLIEIVKENSKITGVEPTFSAAFYSRRSYFKPEKQLYPHGSWDREVLGLKHHFHGPNFATQLGVSKDERWHFFTLAPAVCHSQSGRRLEDGWLELMMTGLDEEFASGFSIRSDHVASPYLEDSILSLDSAVLKCSIVGAEPDDEDPGHALGNVTTRSSKIDELFLSDRQCIDSFAFDPCGYSCNGILLDIGKYFTIHVTPEKGYSYASFETNVGDPNSVEPGLTHQELVERVIKLFSPTKATLVMCMPDERKLVDPGTLDGGAYFTTSEAEFDIGNASVVQYTLLKKNRT